MRVNEYKSLSDFTNEYTGIWDPSDCHWLGLDFKFDDCTYRLNTGSMYSKINTILPDGREALFGLYQSYNDSSDYILLGEYADMDDLLDSRVIKGIKFRDIIINSSTEILGKD